MTSYQEQFKKYDKAPNAGEPARTEAWALLEAAKRLAVAITSGPEGEKETKEERRQALRLNWRLWTIFQAELTREGREDIPREILLNMLTLCKFVDKHTVGALVKPTPEALSTLIDINRNIALGLLQMPEDEVDAELEAREAAQQASAAADEEAPQIKIDTEA